MLSAPVISAVGCKCIGFISELSTVTLVNEYGLMPVSCCLSLCRFVVCFQVKYCDAFSLVFKIDLTIWGTPVVSYKFQDFWHSNILIFS